MRRSIHNYIYLYKWSTCIYISILVNVTIICFELRPVIHFHTGDHELCNTLDLISLDVIDSVKGLYGRSSLFIEMVNR
jgi:glycopeptide antibiotics resistance protein